MCFHKWVIVYSQDKWYYEQCSRCGKRKTVERIKEGYQPKKYPDWDN